MRRLLTVVLASLLGTISFVSVASAQTGDSVTGDAQIVFRGLTFLDIDLDAHSGPSGEHPSGTAGTAVTCLNVRGNQATIGRADGVLIFVEDNADPSDDRLGANTDLAAPVVECPDPAALLATGLQIGPTTITSGDITVVDAPALPTAKDQCKNGGWRAFGVFKNQGDCVSFVATNGKNQPANSP